MNKLQQTFDSITDRYHIKNDELPNLEMQDRTRLVKAFFKHYKFTADKSIVNYAKKNSVSVDFILDMLQSDLYTVWQQQFINEQFELYSSQLQQEFKEFLEVQRDIEDQRSREFREEEIAEILHSRIPDFDVNAPMAAL